MELFDKKYVHFMWSDELEGRECFVSDTIFGLREAVEHNNEALKSKVAFSDDEDYAFLDKDGRMWQFCYYDPNYEYKIAFNKGKTIQFRNDYNGSWVDIVAAEPIWPDDWEYRVKPHEKTRAYALGDIASILDGTRREGMVTGYDVVNEKYFVAGEWHKSTYLKLLGGGNDNTRVGHEV